MLSDNLPTYKKQCAKLQLTTFPYLPVHGGQDCTGKVLHREDLSIWTDYYNEVNYVE